MFFSPSTKSAYPLKLKKAYEKAGNWPADLIELTTAEYTEFFLGLPPSGKVMGVSASGRPVWIDPPPLTDDELAASEREWRNGELSQADIEINKKEDNGLDASRLRQYRNALRAYPQAPNFPHCDRPKV